MARLPIPGSDDGDWGNILNDYLQVSHDSGGALKTDAVSSSSIQDSSIAAAKLNVSGGSDGQVLTKASGATGGLQWASAGGSPDATTSSKGLIQLSGDLGGTAASPTVPGLANKANVSTTISAGTGLTGGGDLSANRTLTVSYGTGAGTAAQGNDSRITGAVQSTIVDAKGDLVVASAADTITRLPVGSNDQVLTADSTQASGVKWASVASPGGQSSVYPLSAYGFFTASDGLSNCTAVSSLGTAFFARIFVPAGKAINAVGTIVASAGTVGAGGLNSFGIYDDAGTLVTSTVVDDTMWQTTGWLIKTLSSPIAAQGSDRFVYCAASCEGYSAQPNIVYNNTLSSTLTAGGGYLVNNRRTFYNGISSWPASINPATYGNQSSNYLPLIVLG